MTKESQVDPNNPLKNSQSTEQDEDSYNPDQRPPNIKLCKQHQIANRVGIPKQVKGVNKISDIPKMCPCCANIIENKPLGLYCDLKDIGFLGSGIPLFFEFIKFCIYVSLIIGVCVTIQGVSINIEGNTCDLLDNCPGKIYQTFSTQNRTEKGINNSFSGLNFLCFIVLAFYSAYFRKRVYTINNEIDRDNITPSDYTVMVSGYPKNISDQQIANHLANCLQTSGKNQVKLQVTKVVQVYDISQFNKLNNLRNKLINKQNRLFSQKKQNKSGVDAQITSIDGEIKQIDQQIEEFKQKSKSQSGGSQFASSGIAFVSFLKDQYVDFVIGAFEQNIFTRIFSCFYEPNGYKVGRVTYPLKVKRASEPTDIIWENINISKNEKNKARLITDFFTLIAIGASFGLIYLFSYLQETSKQEGGFQAQGLSLAASFVIMILNTIIQKLVRIFAVFEKHNTYTHYQASVAKKLGLAQFVNTAAVTYLVNIIFNGKQFIVNGGLVSDISYILLINAVLPPILEYLNPFHILKFYKIKKIEEDPQNCSLTQQQAHSIFQGPQFDIAKHYASCIKIMLSSCFFIYLMPYAVVFPFIGLIFFYWQIKYQLLRRSAKPNSIGPEISHEIIDFSVELIILVYSIGCFIFEKSIYDELSPYIYLQFVFAIIYYIFPVYKICLSCASNNRSNTVQQYHAVQGLFSTDYDRTNPVTQQEAIQQYMSSLGLQYNDPNKNGGQFMQVGQNPYQQRQNLMPTMFGMQPMAQNNMNNQQYQQQRMQQMQMQRMQYQNQMARQQLGQMSGQNQMQNRNDFLQQFQLARQHLMMNVGQFKGQQLITQVGQPQFVPFQYNQQPQQMPQNIQQIQPQQQQQQYQSNQHNRRQVLPQNNQIQNISQNNSQIPLMQPNMQMQSPPQNQQNQMYSQGNPSLNQQQGIKSSGVIPMVNNNNPGSQQQLQQNQQQNQSLQQQQHPMNQYQQQQNMMGQQQFQQGQPQYQQQQFPPHMFGNPMGGPQWQPQNPFQGGNNK